MADEVSAQDGEMGQRARLRAAHEDRDQVVEVLRVAAGDGRLTAEELDDRVGAALTARTYGELAALVSDLPAGSDPPPEARPKDVARIECHMGSARRDGPWMVPRRLELRISHGSVRLDFTEAVTTWPSLQIDVDIRSGSLTLVTRPGILVSTDDLQIRAASVNVRAPWGPDVPVSFRIDVSGTADASSIKARPARLRRTFWQWLLRRPAPQALPPGRT
jgi:Domain of unknown function (DUF1707)